jgi:multidrug efflux pump subunit AcrA (membrane-fusion protein)
MEQPSRTPLALLEIERRIRSSASDREVAFRAVNETTEALRFDQAVLWRIDALSRSAVVSASGLADVTVDSPYQQWLAKLIRSSLPEPFTAARAVALADLPDGLAAEGEEWARAHMLFCPLIQPGGEVLGGMAFFRAQPFSEQEAAVAQWIAEAVGFALWAWRRERPQYRRWFKGRNALRIAGGTVAAVVLLGLIPVRLTALAPAEISPLKPTPVTAPLDAVVREVVVKPNQEVKAGQVVAILDDTTIRNKLALAENALEIARADLQRVVHKSFTDEASRLDLQVLDTRVREKVAEARYLSELLGKLKLVAPQNGIAIFSNADEWAGKTVQVGQRVMLIADPMLVDVTVYLAPEDAVELEVGADVTVYLHADPLSSLKAKITRSSYEAVPSSDGKLAYQIHAELAAGQERPQIGLRGTAKISAGKVTLAFYLFRRPLAFLRKSFGV